jgi:hypothetical protein
VSVIFINSFPFSWDFQESVLGSRGTVEIYTRADEKPYFTHDL